MIWVRKWWRAALALAALVIAAQAGAFLLARTHRVHDYLVARLARSFGRSVEVRHFSILLLPSPVLDAEQVTVGEDPAFGKEYFLRADRLTAGLRWGGLLRGHFEFGTLSLSHPSLILVHNGEGRWNLERWLPPAKKTPGESGQVYGPQPPSTPPNRLQRIDIDDGRIDFKLGDEKLPFAFMGVSGSVEQVSTGRWQLQLEAQPWRSGVTLQSTGTVVVRGDVAGTSARLQPAEIRVHWDRVSLADLFRLFRGQDYGVRGEFALDGTAESGGLERSSISAARPGDWTFSLQARARQIHRWDLTERPDNPGVNVALDGRWNIPAARVIAERLVVETAKSNLRGSAHVSGGAAPAWEVQVDSAGVQAADLLAWTRAFRPGMDDGISAEQFFTGAMTLRGWPLELSDAAFSSEGGEVRVPGLSFALRVGSFEGGRERDKLTVEPVRISYTDPNRADSGANPAAAAKRRNLLEGTGTVAVGFAHDFTKHAGAISIEGRVERAEDVLRIASAFGRTLNHGWELSGPANAGMRWEWNAQRTHWNGRIEVNKGALQAAGLNQPLQMNKAALQWNDGLRTADIGEVEAFGATWSGQISQTPPSEGDDENTWTFKLHANHLDAAALDRWMGPRARPGWLQRLLPSLLGGAAPNPPASELLRRIHAEGELRVDEFTLEKVKLSQVRALGALHDLHLEVRDAEAQWAGGKVRVKMRAAFQPRPSYDVVADLDRIKLEQLPAAAQLPERFAGLASGTLHLMTQGVGRDDLLQRLTGKGEVRLRNVEFLGWDVSASVADGEPRAGASRWATGDGAFTVGDRGIVLLGLRLEAGSQMTLVKGTVSFGQQIDLTVQTGGETQPVGPPAERHRVLKISGPLSVPRVSIEKAVARQPAD
jgi:hypothetical protein